jgi:hypothetical protein
MAMAVPLRRTNQVHRVIVGDAHEFHSQQCTPHPSSSHAAPAKGSHVAVLRSELEQTQSSGEFQTRFPKSLGYIAVSRAGFNLNKTEAIFYLDHFCSLCGGGRYVLMRKPAGIWKIMDEHSTWVSWSRQNGPSLNCYKSASRPTTRS